MKQNLLPFPVVGAEPVGLTSAKLLQKYATDFRVISSEENMRPVEQSRAEDNH